MRDGKFLLAELECRAAQSGVRVTTWHFWGPAGKKVEVERGSGHGARGGDGVTVQAGEQGIRFLLVSGKPLEEPVAWYGPIVMNTQAELKQAFTELNNGTFLKHKG